MSSMLLSSLSRLFRPGTMTKNELSKNAAGLEEALDCISHYDALEQKGMYVDGYEYPLHLYKNGVQQRLQDMADETHLRVHMLISKDEKHGYDASYAGEEFAKFLRVHGQRTTVVLRVYVKHPKTPAESVPVQLLGSLIWNMISLVPDEFETSGGLHRRYFKAFERHLGGRKLFCIVDGLELAEDCTALGHVRALVRVLRDVVAWNNGQLVYTFSKESRITHLIRMLMS